MHTTWGIVKNVDSNSGNWNWGFNYSNGTWGDQTIVQGDKDHVATIASDYPYVAVPRSLWEIIMDDLSSKGFVCFASSTPQNTYCEVNADCKQYVDRLNDLVLNFSEWTLTLPADAYLFDDKKNGVCKAMLSSTAIGGEDDVILGGPFFANQIVSLNFMDNTISVYAKYDWSATLFDDEFSIELLQE